MTDIAARHREGYGGTCATCIKPFGQSWQNAPWPCDAELMRRERDAAEADAEALAEALHNRRKYGNDHLSHLVDCQKYGVGRGGGSRAAWPCTCGRDEAQKHEDDALDAYDKDHER